MTLFPVCVLTALSLVPTFVPGQGASRDTLAQMRFFGGMSKEETAEALSSLDWHHQARLAAREALVSARAGCFLNVTTPGRWARIERLYHEALEAAGRRVSVSALRGGPECARA